MRLTIKHEHLGEKRSAEIRLDEPPSLSRKDTMEFCKRASAELNRAFHAIWWPDASIEKETLHVSTEP